MTAHLPFGSGTSLSSVALPLTSLPCDVRRRDASIDGLSPDVFCEIKKIFMRRVIDENSKTETRVAILKLAGKGRDDKKRRRDW